MNELGEHSIFGPEPCAYTLTRQVMKLSKTDRRKLVTIYIEYVISAKESDIIVNDKARHFIMRALIEQARIKILNKKLNTNSILSDKDLKYIKDALFFCVKTRLKQLYY